MTMEHTPVLPYETIKYLAPSRNKNYIDATCGFGGHTKLILEKNGPGGKVMAIDQDKVALAAAKENLKNFSARVDFAQSNFSRLGLLRREWPVGEVHGILFDLGVSTYQLKSPERGFSFLPRGKAGNLDAELDMRMAPDTQSLSAKDIVNNWSERELERILETYGEEVHARKIAREIVKARHRGSIVYTNELVEIVKRALPPKYRFRRERHFATATFRALRMVVNNELKNLESGLKQAIQIISPGGRIVVISFHSLEDRIVKNFFRENENLEILTPKPVTASPNEIRLNPSARSAKLRAAIRLNPKFEIRNSKQILNFK